MKTTREVVAAAKAAFGERVSTAVTAKLVYCSSTSNRHGLAISTSKPWCRVSRYAAPPWKRSVRYFEAATLPAALREAAEACEVEAPEFAAKMRTTARNLE